MSYLDSDTFNYEDRTISVSEIDTEDDTCRLNLRTDSDALVASIQAVGLINPPVLRQRQDLKYQIVCGFRRVMACKTLGWHEIKVRILKGTPAELDALKLAILDNRSYRQLNVVEQARGIQKVSSRLPKDNRLQMLSSLLGFPENQKVFKKLEALSRLPGAIQEGVTDEIISFEAAVNLTEFSHEDLVLS
jgi:ParB family chromosome partitioning protein